MMKTLSLKSLAAAISLCALAGFARKYCAYICSTR